ncbi:MAG: hypothetical protein ACT4P9_15655 [Betaproteobacteria bacterium]
MSTAPGNVYCTIFDGGYLAAALALRQSLLEASPHARAALVCTDPVALETLRAMQLPRTILVPYEAIATQALDRMRGERNRGEFSWTLKPYALLHLAREFPEAAWLVYVDADMMFFGDPDLALPAADRHYVITPHRFHPSFTRYARTAGLHNAGYVAMRGTPEGLRAIEWWRDRCFESCSAVPTVDTYADQLYLDRLPQLFPYGEASAHPGLNAAPWNIERYDVSAGARGEVLLDGVPLLLYHFQALRVLNSWLVDLYAGDRRLSQPVRDLVYQPYLARLGAAWRAMHETSGAGAAAVPSRLRSPLDWLRLARGVLMGRHNLLRRRIAS